MSSRNIMRACLVAVLVLLVLIAIAIAAAFLQGRRTPRAAPTYVALGSSFAAGAGLGKLEPGSPLLCARSVNGYPQQLARMRALSIVDMSCGGAVTRHLLRGGQFFQGPQIRVIDGRTRLVTITAGGNDIGYIGDLSLLAMRKGHGPMAWLANALWKGPKPAAARDYAGVEGALVATLKAIHAKAPQATVIVATYPAIVPSSGSCARLGLTADEAALMHDVGDRLAAATRAAALAGGAILVDVNALGAGHDACSPAPWTRGWTNGGAAPFHPTLAGAQAVAAAVSAAMDAKPKPGG